MSLQLAHGQVQEMILKKKFGLKKLATTIHLELVKFWLVAPLKY